MFVVSVPSGNGYLLDDAGKLHALSTAADAAAFAAALTTVALSEAQLSGLDPALTVTTPPPVVVTPPPVVVTPPPVTTAPQPGAIAAQKLTQAQLDFSGSGTWNSGETAVEGYIKQGLAIMGITDAAAVALWVAGFTTIASRESAYNSPQWQVAGDSNAIGPDQSDGHPLQATRGMCQCVPWFANGDIGTFAFYHQSGTSGKVYDPVANFCAAANYVMSYPSADPNNPGYGVNRDGSDLAAKVQQANPNLPAKGY